MKPEAYFEVESFNSRLLPDQDGFLYITYRNVGNQVAENAVASIDVEDPFSSTDDEAFLGNLEPGESYETKYRIEVDTGTLPKTYGIDTVVEYRDENGNTKQSNIMTAQVKVDKTLLLSERITSPGYLVVIAVMLGAAGIYIFRKRSKKGDH